MHPSLLFTLLLPALSSADEAQRPLGERAKGWFSAAKQYVPTAFPTVPGLTAIPVMPKPTAKSPVSASASKIAALKVHQLSMSNYRDTLTPPGTAKGPTDWMVYVTGGNKTCGGHCHNLDVNWNETASILATDPLAPKLGLINCDNERVLCAVWGAKPPTIWHIRRPPPSEGGKTDIYIQYLNFTKTTTSDMVSIHTSNKYLDGVLYEGNFHLYDGILAQNGLLDFAGYILFGFSLIPSWALMLTISMGSRAIIQRRAGVDGQGGRRPQPQGGAPPANER